MKASPPSPKPTHEASDPTVAQKPKLKIQPKRLFAAIAVILVFLAGVSAGISYQERRGQVDLTKFWQVYQLLKDNYVGSVDNSKASEGAVKGLVESLGDPFTAYLSPDDKKSLDSELKGEFEGIGAELTEKDQVITVVAPIAGSPAEKAGVKAKDIVIKIDGQSTDQMTLDDAVSKIRGQKGTTVKLTVLHTGSSTPVDLTITRDSIQVPSVDHKMIANNTVGYIAINQFGEDTVDLAQQAAQDIASKKPKAVIIDLRDDPGGYLNDVPPIAGLFLPPSVVVQEKYKDGKIDQLRSTDVPILPSTPLYILVNGGSASAAEILSGALQDYKRATLVGQKTFGKGSVQVIKDLPGDSAIRITIAEWLTPNGRGINKTGIEPDVKVDGDKTDAADPVLDKALSLIASK